MNHLKSLKVSAPNIAIAGGNDHHGGMGKKMLLVVKKNVKLSLIMAFSTFFSMLMLFIFKMMEVNATSQEELDTIYAYSFLTIILPSADLLVKLFGMLLMTSSWIPQWINRLLNINSKNTSTTNNNTNNSNSNNAKVSDHNSTSLHQVFNVKTEFATSNSIASSNIN